jgi:hypothetical protein
MIHCKNRESGCLSPTTACGCACGACQLRVRQDLVAEIARLEGELTALRAEVAKVLAKGKDVAPGEATSPSK